MCFSDTVESLFSLISSSELLSKLDFKGKSVLLVAFYEELLFSLGSNISEMLEESIWDWDTTSVSGNSWNGKSGDGPGAGTDSEIEAGIIGIFLSANIPPICWYCCCTGGLYSFRSPLSSKKSASVCGNGAVWTQFILPGPVEEDWFCWLELSFGKLPDFLQHFLRWPLMPQPLHVTSLALYSSRCFLL